MTKSEPFTYHRHAQATLLEERGGRYASKALGPEVLTGSEAIAAPPRIEGEGPYAVPDGVGPEPPLGVDITIAPDIGEPLPPSQSSPSPSAVVMDGAETFAAPVSPTAVVARRSPQIHEQKRRRMP
jgi:hypothetical protein